MIKILLSCSEIYFDLEYTSLDITLKIFENIYTQSRNYLNIAIEKLGSVLQRLPGLNFNSQAQLPYLLTDFLNLVS